MTEETTEAKQTLTQVRELRIRTRALAHGGVWLPVAVIAVLLLLSISLYRSPFVEVRQWQWQSPFWGGLPDDPRNPRLAYAFWFLLTPTAFALIAVWYRRRARRLGVRIRWQWFVGAGLLALLALVALAAVPTGPPPANPDDLTSTGLRVDVLGGLLTPILPIALALVVLAWAERSVALAVTGLWIGITTWWFCAAGPGRLPGWLVWILDGFQSPGMGGTLGLLGRPGPVLVAMALPLLVYSAIRGIRSRR